MTIEVTTTETKTETKTKEVAVPLNSFHKWIDSYFTYIDETGRIVEVLNLETRRAIRCFDPNDADYAKNVDEILRDYTPCTANEFWNAYTKVHAKTAVDLEFLELVETDNIF